MRSAVASRYAKALTDLSFDPKANLSPDQIAAELGSFLEVMSSSPDLRSVLVSPAVPHSRKRAVAIRISEKLGFSVTTRNFLSVVIAHGRTPELKPIQQAFLAQIDERRGVARATVASAAPLSDEQRRSLEERLSRMTGKRVRSEYSVDPKLLGGVSVRIGSEVYDGSVRGRLSAIGARLTATV